VRYLNSVIYFSVFAITYLTNCQFAKRLPGMNSKTTSSARTGGLSLPSSLFIQARKKAFSKELSFSGYVRTLIEKDLNSPLPHEKQNKPTHRPR
jgi:hypothetical protein